MHTARQLKQEQFSIEVGGEPATRDELFVEWGPLHRLGVVIHEPFGAVGASYAIQLAITAFFDERPQRRSREEPVYPDIFAFHVGGRWGDLVNFDFFPSRKEIFVDNGPMDVLSTINDRGITHLLVPDRPVDHVQHEYKEPQQAIDRMVAAWAYSASGRTEGADVFVTGSQPAVEANTKMTLHSAAAFYERQQAMDAIGVVKIPDDEVMLFPDSREAEVSEELRDRIWNGREALKGERGWTETYRRISVRDAFGMLHIGEAPEFVEQPTMTWDEQEAPAS